MSRDEHYLIDLCDGILGRVAKRQHRFDFLVGDLGRNGRVRHLPVDAYYPDLNLVIEYHERQHTEAVALMDRRMTISGVTRGEQRRRYDERRRQFCAEKRITLLELDYSLFKCTPNKRLRRERAGDEAVLTERLQEFVAIRPDCSASGWTISSSVTVCP